MTYSQSTSRVRLLDTLEAISDRFSGRLAISARELTTGEQVSVNGAEVVPTASVIKLPILLEFLRQVDDGHLSLATRICPTPDETVGGSGILAQLQPGLSLTLLDVATLMIVLSDNTATNVALRLIGGVEPVNRMIAELGLRATHLYAAIDFDVIGSDIRRFGESCTDDLCELTYGIARRQVISPWVSTTAEEILSGQQYLDQLPRYFATTPHWRALGQTPVLRVACKTGFFPGTRVDAGIIRYGDVGGFAYAVANHGCRDQSFRPEAEGAIANGLVGKALLSHWWPAGETAPVFATAYDI